MARIADAVNDEPSSEKDGVNSPDKDEPSLKEGDTTTRDRNDEVDVSDAESISEMINQIRWDTLYHEEDSIPLQNRIKTAPKRVLQQMAYTRLMEDRMRDVEERLRLIENKSVAPELAPPPGKTNQPADLIMKIKRMTFQEYLPAYPNPGLKAGIPLESIEHKRRHEFPGQLPCHLIDVVGSATHQPERLGKDQASEPVAGPPALAASSLAITAQDPTTSHGQFVQPERIRINSTLLLDALHQTTGSVFSTSCTGDTRELQDQVILRPFKLFITFEQEIRDKIDRLEKIHMPNKNGCKAAETAKNDDQDPPSRPITGSLDKISEASSPDQSLDPRISKSQHTKTDALVGVEDEAILPSESIRCLEELRVLKELLDKDLKPVFDLRKQIIDGVARSIAFQDLWHLFPLGEEVISNDSDGQNQVYRILDVSGGKVFLCDRGQAEMEMLDSTSKARDLPCFEILSYFYDSDGKELGACQRLHTIKWYDGNKAITSLPCFPIKYLRNARGMKPRDFFIERGRRFIELTQKTDVVHKRYDGLTLAMNELREEVRPTLNVMRAIG